eukprot:SAG31_NODE_3650_length_4028_cov_1.617205_3_plen_162_part_00
MWKTAKAEGLRGLFKGLAPSLTSIMPYVGIGFTMYDELKLRLRPAEDSARSQELSFGGRLFCGSVSGVVAQSITYPIDTVRRRMQVRRNRTLVRGVLIFIRLRKVDGMMGNACEYRGAVDCARKLLQQGGASIFYRGLAVNAAKTTPGAAIQVIQSCIEFY